MILSSFEFSNTEFGDLLVATESNINVRIYRYIRLSTYIGMSQPIPRRAICGSDVGLEIKNNGFAVKAKWRLFDGGRLIQRGTTDSNGKSDSLRLCQPFEAKSYRLVVLV